MTTLWDTTGAAVIKALEAERRHAGSVSSGLALTLVAVVESLLSRRAESVRCVCLLAAPEGIARVERAFPDDDVSLVVAAVDDRLDERSYIVPGLGDAGDRLFGSPPAG